MTDCWIVDLAAKLYGWKPQLLDGPTFKSINASNDCGKPGDAFQKWHACAEYMYTEENWRDFCKCLEARKIMKTLKTKQKAQKGKLNTFNGGYNDNMHY